MQVLVIGKGRAGRAHLARLEALGVPARSLDTNIKCRPDYTRLEEVPDAFEYAIIATPPDSHFYYLRACLERGMYVLCEKPLSAFGPLPDYRSLKYNDRVMLHFNYAFHPEVLHFKARGINVEPYSVWMVCLQQRQLPPWGIVLDHVAHDVFILDHLFGIERVSRGLNFKAGGLEGVVVVGTFVQHGGFMILDAVGPVDRVARVHIGRLGIPMLPELTTYSFELYNCAEMYLTALETFLKGPPYALDLQVGARIQVFLNQIGGRS